MYVTISHLEMWFNENSFMQACNEGKRCFHNYNVNYFAGILKSVFWKNTNLCIKFERYGNSL